ncbi:hypothetical protein JKF63_02222 [Porcisia hertigi]|uniref:Uncharacterized protein n=1 Tax=Porcisia hertigi TaxID=2761500 RepID=A0A836HZ34_9TRYP|nr:hypothetical protein JKF63_02222 [Porcisia hertigi]
MLSGFVSSFHNRSDCPTMSLSGGDSSSTEDDRKISFDAYSNATSQRNVSFPPTETPAMTPPVSDVFLSPKSGSVAAGAIPSPSYANTSTTTQGPAPGRQRAAPLVETAPDTPQALSGVHKTHSSAVDHPLLGLRGKAKGNRSLKELNSAVLMGGERTDGQPLLDSRVASPSVRKSDDFEPFGAASAGLPPLSLGRSLSCPSPGLGSRRPLRKDTVAETSGSRVLPPLSPPARLPSILFTGAGNKTPTRGSTEHPAISARGSSPSPPDGAVHSGAGAAAQQLVSVTTAVDSANKLWSAVRQLVSDGGGLLSAYIESLVNPAGMPAAAAAKTPGANVASWRVGQRPLRSSHTLNAPTSSTISTSSSFDFTYNASRPTPEGHVRLSSGPGAVRRAFEPYHGSTATHSDDTDSYNGGSLAMPLDMVVIDSSHDPFLRNSPAIDHPVVRGAVPASVNNSFTGAESEAGLGADDYDGMPSTYVVDLLSALRGYQSNPTEPFGHLVAAALASRSQEMPVRGFEVAAAEHNPYLVRLIVDSGSLDMMDVEAQRNVQETMDELVSINDSELNPVIYDYLISFFRMPFVRLSHKQYITLKRSGFEYIKLMYDHQHVLPEESLHSILINQSRTMGILNLIFMAVLLSTIVLSTLAIALVLVHWVKAGGGALQSFGIYTLVAFGGGWALNLIFMVCTVRSRQNELQYEPETRGKEYLRMPSSYAAVVPVLPLFDILCIITYVRALKQKRMILGHNIVACSRLSGIFYAVLFAFPHLIIQSYFNNIETSIKPEYQHHWTYYLLLTATVTQWCVALFGYAWLLFTHDSIDGLGFACFNRGKLAHPLEQHSAVAHLLHFVMASLLETNVFLVTVTAIKLSSITCCVYLIIIIVLSSVTIVYILVVYLVIILTPGSPVRISFSCVPLFLMQVVLLVCTTRINADTWTSYRPTFLRWSFIFGYLSWGAYFALFILWIIVMIQWCILYKAGVNFFPRFLWPWVRRDTRFVSPKKSNSSSEAFPIDLSSQMPEGSAGRAAPSASP